MHAWIIWACMFILISRWGQAAVRNLCPLFGNKESGLLKIKYNMPKFSSLWWQMLRLSYFYLMCMISSSVLITRKVWFCPGSRWNAAEKYDSLAKYCEHLRKVCDKPLHILRKDKSEESGQNLGIFKPQASNFCFNKREKKKKNQKTIEKDSNN